MLCSRFCNATISSLACFSCCCCCTSCWSSCSTVHTLAAANWERDYYEVDKCILCIKEHGWAFAVQDEWVTSSVVIRRPKMHQNRALIGSFKQKRRNPYIAISPEQQSNYRFEDQVLTTKHTLWVVCYYTEANKHGWRPPSRKSIWRHFFAAWMVRFGWNFAASRRMTCILR